MGGVDQSLVTLFAQKQRRPGLPARLFVGLHYLKRGLCKKKLQSMTRFGGCRFL